MAAGGGQRALGGADYYSLDAVLAEETLIPCMFKCGSRGVGRALDPSSGAEDVAVRAAVELPLWMLQPLTSRDMLAVKCAPPAMLDIFLTISDKPSSTEAGVLRGSSSAFATYSDHASMFTIRAHLLQFLQFCKGLSVLCS